jgi:hypothetical protein
MNSSSWIWQEFSQEERWRKLIADGCSMFSRIAWSAW